MIKLSTTSFPNHREEIIGIEIEDHSQDFNPPASVQNTVFWLYLCWVTSIIKARQSYQI